MGGRGASYSIPGGGGGGNFDSSGLGPNVGKDLKESIGKKGKPIGLTEAYKDANPHFDKTGSYAEYTQNCQRCVVAYELRRRGYDVTALPTYQGDRRGEVVYRDASGAKHGRWQGAFRDAKSVSVAGKSPAAIDKNIHDKMNEYGHGSRAVVSVTYKGKSFGHVFSVENRHGTMYYVDAQTGDRIRGAQFFKIVDGRSVTLVRTDNLRMSDRAKNFVTSESAYKRRK